MTHHVSIDSIFQQRLNNLPTMEQLITIQQLRFLRKIARLPTSRLTRQIINSHAIAPRGTKLSGGGHLSTRKSLRDALVKADLTSTNGAPLKEWMPLLADKYIGPHIDRALKLPEGTFDNRHRRG